MKSLIVSLFLHQHVALINNDSVWKISVKRMANLLYHPDIIYKYSSMYKEEIKILNYLTQLTPDVFGRTVYINEIEQNPKPKNILDKLVEMEKKQLINRERVFDQIHTFVVAVT